jgi:hypothetical protein
MTENHGVSGSNASPAGAAEVGAAEVGVGHDHGLQVGLFQIGVPKLDHGCPSG